MVRSGPVPPKPRNYERAALAAGLVRVDAEGRVWRVRRYGRPCAPSRADVGFHADGYRLVPVRLDGRRVGLLAHRLVYEARVGPIPDGYLVRHRDPNGDRTDNRPEHLEAVPPTATPLRRPRAATGVPGANGVSDRSGAVDVAGLPGASAAAVNTSLSDRVSSEKERE